ncbi:MAG: ThiF family adenylyltransferase [Deltaproteobacteria bacterium]|nr:ThiF family adenylyltransferase [Deltaproteobacteria bacterium]
MSNHRLPPENIASATKSLDVEGFSQLEECQWHEGAGKWILKCRLSIQSADVELVPNDSDWYISLDERYPRGHIEFLPANDGGLTKTFQHQFYNGVGEDDVPWRKGNICAKSGIYHLARAGYDIEPFEVGERLKWHVSRAKEWLEKASSQTLVAQGELFELPDFSTSNMKSSVVFCECFELYELWKPYIGRTGTFNLAYFRESPNRFLITSFKDHLGKTIYEPHWSQHTKERFAGRTEIGAWALLPKPVVIPPWQAPMDWSELMQAVSLQETDYRRLMLRICTPLRDGQEHCVCLGFPIPKRIGEDPRQVHWQPLLLPALSWKKDHAGFRTTKVSLLLRDLTVVFKSNGRIAWQRTENWHPDEILNRGRLNPWLRESKVLIVGAGALGATIAEMLVRGGTQSIALVDNDKLEMGNLVRHTLTMDDIGKSKVGAVKERLSKLSPFASIAGIEQKFEKLNSESIETIKDVNLVVDCTGNDDVLHYLEAFPWTQNPTFWSLSLGLHAKRLYILASRRMKFPTGFLQRHVKKWLSKDIDEYDEPELARSGGLGCWHPAFPARGDEILMCAATSLRYFDEYTQTQGGYSKFAVFEQVSKDGDFGGFVLMDECDDR